MDSNRLEELRLLYARIRNCETSDFLAHSSSWFSSLFSVVTDSTLNDRLVAAAYLSLSALVGETAHFAYLSRSFATNHWPKLLQHIVNPETKCSVALWHCLSALLRSYPNIVSANKGRLESTVRHFIGVGLLNNDHRVADLAAECYAFLVKAGPMGDKGSNHVSNYSKAMRNLVHSLSIQLHRLEQNPEEDADDPTEVDSPFPLDADLSPACKTVARLFLCCEKLFTCISMPVVVPLAISELMTVLCGALSLEQVDNEQDGLTEIHIAAMRLFRTLVDSLSTCVLTPYVADVSLKVVSIMIKLYDSAGLTPAAVKQQEEAVAMLDCLLVKFGSASKLQQAAESLFICVISQWKRFGQQKDGVAILNGAQHSGVVGGRKTKRKKRTSETADASPQELLSSADQFITRCTLSDVTVRGMVAANKLVNAVLRSTGSSIKPDIYAEMQRQLCLLCCRVFVHGDRCHDMWRNGDVQCSLLRLLSTLLAVRCVGVGQPAQVAHRVFTVALTTAANEEAISLARDGIAALHILCQPVVPALELGSTYVCDRAYDFEVNSVHQSIVTDPSLPARSPSPDQVLVRIDDSVNIDDSDDEELMPDTKKKRQSPEPIEEEEVTIIEGEVIGLVDKGETPITTKRKRRRSKVKNKQTPFTVPDDEVVVTKPADDVLPFDDVALHPPLMTSVNDMLQDFMEA